MEQETDVSITMTNDVMRYVYERYPNLTCGDYIAFASVLTHNVAKWVGDTMKTNPKEIENLIFSQVIQLDILEGGKSE